MAKAQQETSFLVSSSGSGYFYTNRRNKKKMKGETKLKFKKYDPIARRHVEFGEKKLSKLKKPFDGDAFRASTASTETNTEA